MVLGGHIQTRLLGRDMRRMVKMAIRLLQNTQLTARIGMPDLRKVISICSYTPTGVASGSINRIVAEDGADGQYTDFQFAKSTSATVAPTEGWQDVPTGVSASEYLWMRSGVGDAPFNDSDNVDCCTYWRGKRQLGGC